MRGSISRVFLSGKRMSRLRSIDYILVKEIDFDDSHPDWLQYTLGGGLDFRARVLGVVTRARGEGSVEDFEVVVYLGGGKHKIHHLEFIMAFIILGWGHYEAKMVNLSLSLVSQTVRSMVEKDRGRRGKRRCRVRNGRLLVTPRSRQV